MLKGFVLRRKAADKSFVAKTPVRARVTTPVLDQIYILPQNDPVLPLAVEQKFNRISLRPVGRRDPSGPLIRRFSVPSRPKLPKDKLAFCILRTRCAQRLHA